MVEEQSLTLSLIYSSMLVYKPLFRGVALQSHRTNSIAHHYQYKQSYYHFNISELSRLDSAFLHFSLPSKVFLDVSKCLNMCERLEGFRFQSVEWRVERGQWGNVELLVVGISIEFHFSILDIIFDKLFL